MLTERRQFVRWQINRQAQCQLEGTAAPINCTIHDIGYKGARISFAGELPINTAVKIGIILSNEMRCLNIEARIAWHSEATNTNIYGVCFAKIMDSDKETIYQFLRKYYSQEMAKKWWS